MAADDTPLSPCECSTDDNRYSDGVVRLAFGERPDGTMAHISRVERGLACDCHCPACKTPLVAHKGQDVRHHFAHKASGDCGKACETSLHKAAKEILNEVLHLRVPEVRAEIEDAELLKYRAGDYTFDEARLEHRLGDIIPDVVVRLGDRELLVEIAVSHPCDEDKIAKIRALGIAAVEIDLSDVPLDASFEVVRDAILRTAPREWLYNPKLDEAHAELQARLDRQEERRRDQARRHVQRHLQLIEKAKADQASAHADDEIVERVVADGYGHVIGIEIAGDYCFRMSRRRWQAHILEAFVLRWLRRDDDRLVLWRTNDVFGWVRKARFLRPDLPAYVDEPLEAELRACLPDYQYPYAVVETYLRRLESAGLLEAYAYNWSFTGEITREWRERRRITEDRNERRGYVFGTLARILGNVPNPEIEGFDQEVWANTIQPAFGASFADVIETGDAPWWEMRRALGKIERMVQYKSDVAEDLLGLRLERERARVIEYRRLHELEAQRAKEEAAQRAADSRERELEASATEYFGSLAQPWMDDPRRMPDGVAPRIHARADAEGLQRAETAARAEYERREAERRRVGLALRCLEKLETEARRRLPPEQVPLFMHNTHPKLKGKRPRDYCVDDATLATCLALLETQTKRR